MKTLTGITFCSCVAKEYLPAQLPTRFVRLRRTGLASALPTHGCNEIYDQHAGLVTRIGDEALAQPNAPVAKTGSQKQTAREANRKPEEMLAEIENLKRYLATAINNRPDGLRYLRLFERLEEEERSLAYQVNTMARVQALAGTG